MNYISKERTSNMNTEFERYKIFQHLGWKRIDKYYPHQILDQNNTQTQFFADSFDSLISQRINNDIYILLN